MSATTDERFVVLRLASNWRGKVERGELELANAWDLLRERIAAIDKKFAACDVCGSAPCPNPAYCQTCREADQKIIGSRKCAQCGAGGDLDPYQDKERRKIVYLHRGACVRFWRGSHG
jgi:hypothetical protein